MPHGNRFVVTTDFGVSLLGHSYIALKNLPVNGENGGINKIRQEEVVVVGGQRGLEDSTQRRIDEMCRPGSELSSMIVGYQR